MPVYKPQLSHTDLGDGRPHLPSVYEAWSQVTCLNRQQVAVILSYYTTLHHLNLRATGQTLATRVYKYISFATRSKNAHKRNTLICQENTNTLVIPRNCDINSSMAQQPHLYLIYYHQMGTGICLAPVTVPNHFHFDINVHRKPNLTTSSSSSP